MSTPTGFRTALVRAGQLDAGDIIRYRGIRYRVHVQPIYVLHAASQVVLIVLQDSGAGGWLLSQEAIVLPSWERVSREIGGGS